MGTIAEKLSYLADTKDLFKDRLNSLGAEILSTTTFRNYLNWLDTFYGKASDKTDLSENGIVGRTSQDGDPTPENPVEVNNISGDVEYKVRGKNLFDINNALNNNLYNQGTSLSLITNGIRATTEAVSNYRMGLIKIGETNKLIGKTIRVKANFSSNGNNNGRFYIGYCDASGGNRVPKSDTTTSGSTLSMVVESGSGENICLALYSNQDATNYTIGNYVDYKNIIMTIDNEDMTYEPHISESFPLSLKSRNLFDKDNANILNAYISGNKVITTSSEDKTIYIPCKPNTTYTIQKILAEPTAQNKFKVCTTSSVPTLGTVGIDYVGYSTGTTETKITIATSSNANYLCVFMYTASSTITTTLEQMLSSIQIEESSTRTEFEPYYDIELCNISDYKDRIYSQNGKLYLEKKTGKVVLDGSENITQNYNQSMFRAPLDNFVHRIESPSNLGKSNYYTCRTYTDMYNGTIGTGFEFGNQGSDYIYIRNKDITSINDFKSWLTTHNTIVYYVLATPTTTEITSENYPTLYSQLLAIQEFLTKYKINKEFLLDYSSPEIEY